MKYCYLILIICSSHFTHAQNWEKRHSFAKSYFGISNFIVPGLNDGNFLNSAGTIQEFQRNGFTSPAINIGATHFWGYADIYISINTANLKFGTDEQKNRFAFGTFTGVRVYPFPSKEKTIRPYVGYKFSPFRYNQNDIAGNNFKYTKVKSVFDIGLGIQLPNFYFTLEYGRVLNPSFDTYLSRNVKSKDKFPSQILQIGLNYTIETTKGSGGAETEKANRLYSKSNKYGFFLSAGPSSVFPVGTSNYIADLYPFLDNKTNSSIFPDMSIGYHFTKTDLVTALSFRPMTQKRNAYDFQQKINRKSIILEFYKYVADYHGFVPYVGVGVGYENLHLTETDYGSKITQLTQNKFSPAVVFGWDVRPSVKADWWILRTNLRYYPFLNIEHQGKKISLQHLEFNFIQFVLYPQKMKISKNSSKNK